jgi:hypothetical protein
MTHVPASSPALPLSLSCSVDARFAATVAALAGRVATAAGDGSHVACFTDAMAQAAAACFEHLGSNGPDLLGVDFTVQDGEVLGCLRWPSNAPGTDRCTAAVQETVGFMAGRVECGRSDDETYCRVTCRRG